MWQKEGRCLGWEEMPTPKRGSGKVLGNPEQWWDWKAGLGAHPSSVQRCWKYSLLMAPSFSTTACMRCSPYRPDLELKCSLLSCLPRPVSPRDLEGIKEAIWEFFFSHFTILWPHSLTQGAIYSLLLSAYGKQVVSLGCWHLELSQQETWYKPVPERLGKAQEESSIWSCTSKVFRRG